MTRIVEVFWNARPSLDRLGLKVVWTGNLDPAVEQMLARVRSECMTAIPEAVTLVRINVRSKDDSGPELRIAGLEGDEARQGLEAVGEIVARAVRDAQERTQEVA